MLLCFSFEHLWIAVSLAILRYLLIFILDVFYVLSNVYTYSKYEQNVKKSKSVMNNLPNNIVRLTYCQCKWLINIINLYISILITFRCLLIRYRNNRSADYVNTTQQQNSSFYEGVCQALDEHNYEQLSKMEHLYNNINLSHDQRMIKTYDRGTSESRIWWKWYEHFIIVFKCMRDSCMCVCILRF